MRRVSAVLLASAAVAAASTFAAAAHAGPRARMVEAFAEKDFDKATPMRIVPTGDRQAADPVFRLLSDKLRTVLTANGFRAAEDGAPAVAVTMEYFAGPSGLGVASTGSASDPSYRLLLVTGYDTGVFAKPRIVWQTMMEEYGLSDDVRATIPGLVQAAAPYLGVSKTSKNAVPASWCADRPRPMGSHIPVMCLPNTERPVTNKAVLYTTTMVAPPGPGQSGGK